MKRYVMIFLGKYGINQIRVIDNYQTWEFLDRIDAETILRWHTEEEVDAKRKMIGETIDRSVVFLDEDELEVLRVMGA